MRILVVGAGYLGSEIMRVAAGNLIPVIGSRRTLLSAALNNPIIRIDVLKPQTFVDIPEDITHVVYSVSAGSSSEDAYRDAYVIGLSNLLEYFRTRGFFSHLKKFAFISSTGVYTENEGAFVTEESPVGGESFRSFVIAEAEDMLKKYFSPGQYLVTRLSGIYGPGRTYLFNQARQMTDKEIPASDVWTNRIHVQDAARACIYLIGTHSGIYNISDSSPAPRLEVVSYIRQISSLPCIDFSSIKTVSGKRVSNQKLRETGFEFMYPSYREGYREYL